jgi:HlyD family secretion protein
MMVDVRIDSFPFSEFGDIKGKLVWVGSDALPPDQIYPFYRFPAKVELSSQQWLFSGRNIPLQSGMGISTNIKIRDRTVMSIFTDIFSSTIESLKTVR